MKTFKCFAEDIALLEAEKPAKGKYRVMTAFGGNHLGYHSTREQAEKAASKASHKHPVHVWTTKGGDFGMGKAVHHYNDGVGTKLD